MEEVQKSLKVEQAYSSRQKGKNSVKLSIWLLPYMEQTY